ncbi:glycosidase [Desulfosarcina ovata subsp. sediminis]|uniref:Glycosidase n=1 Tax=Desulfosarcina ovata subsp. sediminis TaxID=885957 RepID=A0A5K7ZSD8_9BACT|nr:glycoside hydrolase family 130 protein [Desulfosarcina ovata]BBO83126.1 glycosidase [Desulfosarcina ovata subsp. sediminis]
MQFKNHSPLKVKRKAIKIIGDPARVITRLHLPDERSRINKIIQRIIKLPDPAAEALMAQIMVGFEGRHEDIGTIFERHLNAVKNYLPPDTVLSDLRKSLIGAYFTKEYSIESAALFNPSIVPHPDQSNLKNGSLRFVMSLRATGEGHISSIVFRSGVLDQHNRFRFYPISEYVETPALQLNPVYKRDPFQRKLKEMGAEKEIAAHILNQMPDDFTYNGLMEKIGVLREKPLFPRDRQNKAFEVMWWLANSNYEVEFHPNHRISERVIFPVSKNESRGIEDARFVQFFDDRQTATYYATYTAYNGHTILPQLIETKDFIKFNIVTLNGKAIINKGMALFPRKIGGRYAMLSRQDGENNQIMFSDNIHFWQESKIIHQPEYPWEFVQVGNCGSPLETDQGWIVLTHGVGPMRQYCIGAILLDLENPSKIIARLDSPLLSPHKKEREGYVPNVVYSCGAIIHNNELVIPYAMSDINSGIATVAVDALLKGMRAVES